MLKLLEGEKVGRGMFYADEALVLEYLGGDIRGEYGIGYAKTAYLGEAACGEFKAAKAKLDPKGILNPGKVAD